MNTTLTEKIQKLFQDETFMTKMNEVTEAEDLKALVNRPLLPEGN